MSTVPVPLYQAKADLFRTLGHPVRIRVLELLQDGPKAVRELLLDIDIEASSLSQQLAILRRAGIVTSSRDGAAVMYQLAASDVAELMAAARRFLTEVLAGQGELLAELQRTANSAAEQLMSIMPPRLAALLPDAQDWAAVRRHPRRDLLTGLTVAIVALPLALAFGVAFGLGATAGLITAIVAGILAAVFG